MDGQYWKGDLTMSTSEWLLTSDFWQFLEPWHGRWYEYEIFIASCTDNIYDLENERWLFGDMIDHVGIYGSRVAEGLSAFNVGLVVIVNLHVVFWFLPSGRDRLADDPATMPTQTIQATFTHARSGCGADAGSSAISWGHRWVGVHSLEADVENWVLDPFVAERILLPLRLRSATAYVWTYIWFVLKPIFRPRPLCACMGEHTLRVRFHLHGAVAERSLQCGADFWVTVFSYCLFPQRRGGGRTEADARGGSAGMGPGAMLAPRTLPSGLLCGTWLLV